MRQRLILLPIVIGRDDIRAGVDYVNASLGGEKLVWVAVGSCSHHCRHRLPNLLLEKRSMKWMVMDDVNVNVKVRLKVYMMGGSHR